MRVTSGRVTLSISLNVYDLETDSLYIDSRGNVAIDNGDQFFDDWVEAWRVGRNELLGVSVEDCDLEVEEEDEEDNDKEEMW